MPRVSVVPRIKGALYPQPGDSGLRTVYHARDVQPIFDKHCVGCHSGKEPRGELVLTGDQ